MGLGRRKPRLVESGLPSKVASNRGYCSVPVLLLLGAAGTACPALEGETVGPEVCNLRIGWSVAVSLFIFAPLPLPSPSTVPSCAWVRSFVRSFCPVEKTGRF